MHPEAERLFALDEALRAEADRMLADSGIGAILAEYGYQPVGSYVMRTMTWHDLDFHLAEDPPSPGIKWDFGTRLAQTGWCVRLQFEDFRPQQAPDLPRGVYWGARLVDPAQRDQVAYDSFADIWKLDMWSAPPIAFADSDRRRDEWMRKLTQQTRSYVLAIKEAVWHEPEYRKTMLSVHIYDAVLEHGIRDAAEFRRWWEAARARQDAG
ncbi:MAG: hypothetical protein JSV65_13515 [Armatimonadota bacterium]|nr:MAG: hypothetical protein JSV65_13515 [Armatimonadota bacterium]